MILQCGGISQVVPVEVDPPSKITWDEREDWKEVLVSFVSSGRTDFKPISTTKFGWVLGVLFSVLLSWLMRVVFCRIVYG